MDSRREKQLFAKFQDQVRNIGEPESLYQPFQKIPYNKSKKTQEFKEGQRDAYRETHRTSPKEKEIVKTVVPRQVEMSNYKIYQVLLDSSDRNITNYPSPTNFVLKIPTPLRNVFAVRLLKSELLYHSTTLGNGIYITLNDYKLLIRNEQQDSISLFARITPGVNDFQCVTTNILDDPYTYILNPMEPKLQRFEIKTYDRDNDPKEDVHFNLILHLAIFCYC